MATGRETNDSAEPMAFRLREKVAHANGHDGYALVVAFSLSL